tara:strand:+ start:2134 stop:2268 length:135 start_codon:yes stop_codon:yes gene_type:complete
VGKSETGDVLGRKKEKRRKKEYEEEGMRNEEYEEERIWNKEDIQ